MSTLAAMAALPRRAQLLPLVLRSLRTQVDRIHIYLNGWEEPPECVRDIADEYVIDPVNGGAERKLHWARSFDGVYLSVDDDIIYPPDYVQRMREAVEMWGGRAIVSAHGRVYDARARRVSDVVPGSIGVFTHRCSARWVNHAGTGVMAWDTRRIQVPTEWPEKNAADMQLAIWAQFQKVPIWRIGHAAGWLRGMGIMDPHGLFRRSQREGHMRRNEMLATHSREHGWRLHEAAAC